MREEEALRDLEALLARQRALELGVHRLPVWRQAGEALGRVVDQLLVAYVAAEVLGQGVVDRLDVRA